LIAEELNVKEVHFTDDFKEFASFSLQVNARAAGPRLGSKVQAIIKASKSNDWQIQKDGSVVRGGEKLESAEFTLGLIAREGVLAGGLSTRDAVVVLDTSVTPELEAEGTARDFVRAIQQARKEAQLDVSDRISVQLIGAELHRAAIEKFKAYIGEQVLAYELTLSASLSSGAKPSHIAQIGDASVSICVTKK